MDAGDDIRCRAELRGLAALERGALKLLVGDIDGERRRLCVARAKDRLVRVPTRRGRPVIHPHQANAFHLAA